MKREKRRNSLFKSILLILLSLFLIPLLFILFANLPVLFSGYQSITKTMIYSLSGFIFFTVFYFVVGQPIRSYIISHELGHIIFAVITGTRIGEVSFKMNRSFVRTKGTNVFVALGPYILPIYAVVTILVYKFVVLIFGNLKIITVILYFFTGAGYSFHILSTFHYLKYDQPDMKRYGYFFSLVFVAIWMIIITSILFSLMFSKIELGAYLIKTIKDSAKIYLALFNFVSLFSNN